MDKMKFETTSITEKNIEKIATLFPNCITETIDKNGRLKKAINFEMLRQMLSEEIVEGDENYEFTWVGKKASINGDLIACFDENIPESIVKIIAKRRPIRAVFRDSSFADSPSKINVGEVFKLLAPDTRIKVI